MWKWLSEIHSLSRGISWTSAELKSLSFTPKQWEKIWFEEKVRILKSDFRKLITIFVKHSHPIILTDIIYRTEFSCLSSGSNQVLVQWRYFLSEWLSRWETNKMEWSEWSTPPREKTRAALNKAFSWMLERKFFCIKSNFILRILVLLILMMRLRDYYNPWIIY